MFANVTRDGIAAHVERIASLASARGVDVLLSSDLEELCPDVPHPFADGARLAEEADLVVALGGDGTILRAADLVCNTNTPILGVNLGRLGFLADSTPDVLDLSLERLIRGDYEVEKRLALEAELGDKRSFCLNEFVIERGAHARIIQLMTRIGDVQVSGFWGNGLIVSTPTGSTSYSLSGGGPVLHPSLTAMVVTPICPHSLSQRPLVVPADETIEIEVFAEHQDIILTADGRTMTNLASRDRVTIRRAPHPVRLVNLQGLSFYELLRTKLDWSLANPATEDTQGA